VIAIAHWGLIALVKKYDRVDAEKKTELASLNIRPKNKVFKFVRW
jgi:hypothetical protein